MNSYSDDYQPQLPSQPPPEDVLDFALEEILGRGNPYSYSVLTTIERMLRQFRLSTRVDACDVLIEAYLRGKKQTQAGVRIENPHAWLKGTCFHIIRERKRKLKDHPTDPQILDCLVESSMEDCDVDRQAIADDIDSLHKAMKQLRREEPEGANLLYLRLAEGLSWREIRDRLVDEQGETTPSEVTLRQRASRAKKVLRQIFHSVAAEV